MRMALIQSNYSFKKSDKEIKDFLNNLDANLAILRREASSNSNVICDPTQRFPPRRPIRCVKVNNGDIKVTVRNPEATNHLEVRITLETNVQKEDLLIKQIAAKGSKPTSSHPNFKGNDYRLSF